MAAGLPRPARARPRRRRRRSRAPVHRQPESDRGAASRRPGQRLDPAAVGLDQARGRSKGPGRFRPPACRRRARDRTRRTRCRALPAGCRGPVAYLTPTRPVRSPPNLDPATRGRVLGGVVENVDQHLLDEDRVDVEDRQVVRDPHLDAAAPRAASPSACARGRRSRADRPIRGSAAARRSRAGSCRAGSGRSGSAARSPRGWSARSCARSALDSAPSQLARPVAEPMIETSGVRRSCDTEDSSAERSRSVSVRSRASSISVARLVRSTATAT